MFAFVFPGQGSQSVGMLKTAAAEFNEVEETFAQASEALSMDLWQLCTEGPEEQLNLTQNTQPALLTASVALWRVWCAQTGLRPAYLAGHSLGEYSALVCAEVMEFSSAVQLVQLRGKLMQQAVPAGVGGMAAIIGLTNEQVEACCVDASNEEAVVVPANYNSPGQVVIAGHIAALEKAMQLCKEAGAKRAMPLSVSGPFHSPLMSAAAAEFQQAVQATKLQAAKIGVLQNVPNQVVKDPQEIAGNLVKQLSHPVDWLGAVQALAALEVSCLIECGPGKVLSGLTKRIDKSITTAQLQDQASLSQCLANLA